MSKDKPTPNYRDSGSGRYIPKKEADRKDPKTWEKEKRK
jgi:hypothetical protein